MKLCKLSLEFVLENKFRINLLNFKIDEEDGNGDSNYLYLFYCR